jgi:Glycosyltransferase
VAVPLIAFAGSDKGRRQAVADLATDLGIAEYVRYCGFVPDAHMPYLYRGAVALVMPTYFGPTNIPPMEAAALGVPVCYSDLPAFREQMGDAAFYMDLENPASLADELHRLMEQGVGSRAAKHAASDMIAAAGVQRHVDVLAKIVERYVAKFGS